MIQQSGSLPGYFPKKTKNIFTIPVSNPFSSLTEIEEEEDESTMKETSDKQPSNLLNNTSNLERPNKDLITSTQPKAVTREGEGHL